jgi:hypothetical protein
MGEVISMEACPPIVKDQFEAALGEDFSVRALVNSLKERSLFHEARGVLNSFVADTDVRLAMTDTHDRVYFSSRCLLDEDEDRISEVADYHLDSLDNDPKFDKIVDITISPNALKALYKPVLGIVEAVSGSTEPLMHVNDIASLVYRAVYAKTVAQYVVMRQTMGAIDDPSLLSKFEVMTDYFYEKKFGEDGITDFVVRADRLAMAFGGTVMYRQVSESLDREIGKQSDIGTQQIGQLIKMYAAGVANIRPVDQQRVTFPLVYAFTPNEASRFLKNWFS